MNLYIEWFVPVNKSLKTKISPATAYFSISKIKLRGETTVVSWLSCFGYHIVKGEQKYLSVT